MTEIDLSSEKLIKSVLKQFEDPIRMMIIINILRKPDITSNELKKQLLIPGTKIFYYLKQLSSHQPPLIYESGSEQVTEHLVRRKFRITQEMEDIIRDNFEPKNNPDLYQLYLLHMSIALQYQQLREVKNQIKSNTFEKPDDAMIMFVDAEIAEELREGIAGVFRKCWTKYEGLDRFDAIRACNYGAFAGIYPMS